ncbi:F0F1 ATP synthase subunit gamma [Syntrophus aciditrophicus]|uniref:F0F1 ATP synthase subunit gamma n=1 Tax=Syntrophus aciditrophicus TaxID=316277 RepID=UPI00031BE117|nr:F0F1 ATP synthase subunit gamma [Syntrophus aciditrophicus]
MQTHEALKRKISTTEDLQSVVRTMKSLAAVSIRQYQRALESLNEYKKTLEMGLQIVLKDRDIDLQFRKPKSLNPSRRHHLRVGSGIVRSIERPDGFSCPETHGGIRDQPGKPNCFDHRNASAGSSGR